jgi:hypothetical protein
MTAKLTKLTHRLAIQLHLVAESCDICSSRSRLPDRKLLDTLLYNVSHKSLPVLIYYEGVSKRFQTES